MKKVTAKKEVKTITTSKHTKHEEITFPLVDVISRVKDIVLSTLEDYWVVHDEPSLQVDDWSQSAEIMIEQDEASISEIANKIGRQIESEFNKDEVIENHQEVDDDGNVINNDDEEE